jgi:hypothetical protein
MIDARNKKVLRRVSEKVLVKKGGQLRISSSLYIKNGLFIVQIDAQDS